MVPNPVTTYELILKPKDKTTWTEKEAIKAWLTGNGIDAFVEGAIDDLDIDHAYEDPDHDFYSELGGELTPISIFSYSLEHLEDLKAKIIVTFASTKTVLKSMLSEVWMEGWKESFKPIYASKFVVHPPWDKPANEVLDTFQPIEVEPGMAFGTGQHATTQICMQGLEKLELKGKSLLEVGTGTGVLAIAAKLLGASKVCGTDIDVDAIRAANDNAARNSMTLSFAQGSVPKVGHSLFLEAGYDFVVANILYVVLAKIIGDLAKAVKPGGELMLSGVLVEQAINMVESAERFGLKLSSKDERGGWVCLFFKKA